MRSLEDHLPIEGDMQAEMKNLVLAQDLVLEHLKIYVLMHISLQATLWVLSLGFHSVRLWVDLATKDQRKDKMSALRNVILVQTCMDARNER